MIAMSLALVACGNKGPLVQAPVPVEEVETPEGSVPVDVVPQSQFPRDVPEDALPDPTAVDPLLDPAAEPSELSDPQEAPEPEPEPEPPVVDDGNG